MSSTPEAPRGADPGRPRIDIVLVDSHAASSESLAPAVASGAAEIVLACGDPADPAPLGPWPRGVRVRLAFGLHPRSVDGFALTEQLDALGKRLAAPEVVALGPVGLDVSAPAALGVQELVLQTQLQLARQLALPVLLDVRGEETRASAVLAGGDRLPAGGVWLDFAGTRRFAAKLVARGLTLALGARWLACADADAAALRSISAERVLAASARGDPSVPARVVARLAQIRRCSIPEAAAACDRTAARVLRGSATG